MPGVFDVFVRWWKTIVACISSSGGDSSKVSSPSDTPTRAPPPRSCSVSPSIGQGRPHPDTHRERFLRHPSITSSDGAARGNTSSSTAGKSKTAPQARKPVQEVRPAVAPAFRAQDWSSPSYRPNPPRRPPRPPSILLPAVIITPCTPDGMTSPNFEAILATPESPLDKTIAAYCIASGAAAYGAADVSGRSNTTPMNKTEYHTTHKRPPPTHDRIPGADPPQKELFDVKDPRDTVVVAPDPVEARRNRVTGRVFASSKLRSFIVPDKALSKREKPIDDTGSTSGSSSDQLSGTPPWIYSLSFEQLAALKPLTSTPTKHRIADSVSPETHIFRMSEDTSGTALSLRLPEEQLDLLPYPDVFDLELYYGLESDRLSASTSRDVSSSIIRCSVDEKNVFLPGPTSVMTATRRFGYILAAYPRLSADHVNDENMPPCMPQDRGRVRYSRDVYHLPSFDRRSVSTPTRLDVGTGRNDDTLPVFRPMTAVLATPASSTLASPGCDSGRHVLLPIPLREQMQRTRSNSDSALEMFPTPTPARARSRLAQVQEPSFDTPSPLPGGPGKVRSYTYTASKAHACGPPPDIPLPPIVIVSSVSASNRSRAGRSPFKFAAGCDSSLLSETSDAYDVAQSEESNTSPEVLRSRLQETCDNFSRPIGNTSWVDESVY
ncbi:hypothetical protein D9619_004636 [Psilocybe cf. subviscida]|uniref:Uncharacterized protein n=1 Tax=Psilocybe cf. subviscida TaxID=2480587 RepID=A0A8H5F8G0_9AGAR|nr:hypothetical protein D9619_004636 [Psilocybe cf. subviscida]